MWFKGFWVLTTGPGITRWPVLWHQRGLSWSQQEITNQLSCLFIVSPQTPPWWQQQVATNQLYCDKSLNWSTYSRFQALVLQSAQNLFQTKLLFRIQIVLSKFATNRPKRKYSGVKLFNCFTALPFINRQPAGQPLADKIIPLCLLWRFHLKQSENFQQLLD